MDKSNGSRISDLRDLPEISCSQNQSQNKIDKVGMDLVTEKECRPQNIQFAYYFQSIQLSH